MEESVQTVHKDQTRFEIEVIKRNKEGRRGEAKKISILLRDIQAIGTPAFFDYTHGKYALVIAQGIVYETNESFTPLLDRLRALYRQSKDASMRGVVGFDLLNSCFFYMVGTTGCVNLWSIRSMDHLTHEVTFVDNTKRCLSTTEKAWEDLAERRNKLVINTQKVMDELIVNMAKRSKAENLQNVQAEFAAYVKKLIDVDENAGLAYGMGIVNMFILLLVVLPLLIVILCKI